MTTFAPRPVLTGAFSHREPAVSKLSEAELGLLIQKESQTARLHAKDGMYRMVITPAHIAIRRSDMSLIKVDCCNTSEARRIKALFRKYTPSDIKIRIVGIREKANCSTHPNEKEHMLEVIYYFR